MKLRCAKDWNTTNERYSLRTRNKLWEQIWIQLDDLCMQVVMSIINIIISRTIPIVLDLPKLLY
jgi:hypothetical protein